MRPRLANLLGVSSLVFAFLVAVGCGDRKMDQALDSDANGYLCRKCSEKFYTEREVFANVCPKCRQADIEQVMGFYCPADQHLTLGSRMRGSRMCEKCRQPTAGSKVPKESDLQKWGAAKKSAPEVS